MASGIDRDEDPDPSDEAAVAVQLPEKQDANPVRPYLVRSPERFGQGYPRLAAFMAADEDRSTMIFRRFQRLSSRSLLVYESELSEMEAKLDRLDEEATESLHDEIKMMSMSWEVVDAMKTHPNDTVRKAALTRSLLINDIRVTILQYLTALKVQSDVLALQQPDKIPLKALRQFFRDNPRAKKGREIMDGNIANHLDEGMEDDLCVLAQPKERDRLTRLLDGKWAYFGVKHNQYGGTISHDKIALFVTIISIIATAFFLIGAVLALFFVTSARIHLILISVFTASFAISVGFFTSASRQEVFAATAAYAAVLVVFVTGNLTSASSDSSISGPVTQTILTSTIVSTLTMTHTEAQTIITGLPIATSIANAIAALGTQEAAAATSDAVFASLATQLSGIAFKGFAASLSAQAARESDKAYSIASLVSALKSVPSTDSNIFTSSPSPSPSPYIGLTSGQAIGIGFGVAIGILGIGVAGISLWIRAPSVKNNKKPGNVKDQNR